MKEHLSNMVDLLHLVVTVIRLKESLALSRRQ